MLGRCKYCHQEIDWLECNCDTARAVREAESAAREDLKLRAQSYDANVKGWKADRDAAIKLLRQWIKASDAGDDHNVYQSTKKLLAKLAK